MDQARYIFEYIPEGFFQHPLHLWGVGLAALAVVLSVFSGRLAFVLMVGVIGLFAVAVLVAGSDLAASGMITAVLLAHAFALAIYAASDRRRSRRVAEIADRVDEIGLRMETFLEALDRRAQLVEAQMRAVRRSDAGAPPPAEVIREAPLDQQ